MVFRYNKFYDAKQRCNVFEFLLWFIFVKYYTNKNVVLFNTLLLFLDVSSNHFLNLKSFVKFNFVVCKVFFLFL